MAFWAEFRRRRVFRFAGVYIVGAWVVFQVGDVFFPAWGIPDTALRYLLFAATMCFPVALVFSWYYDVTAHGIARTPPTDDASADSALQRGDYLVLIGLLLTASIIIYANITQIRQSVDDTPLVSGSWGQSKGTK